MPAPALRAAFPTGGGGRVGWLALVGALLDAVLGLFAGLLDLVARLVGGAADVAAGFLEAGGGFVAGVPDAVADVGAGLLDAGRGGVDGLADVRGGGLGFLAGGFQVRVGVRMLVAGRDRDGGEGEARDDG